MNGLKKIRIVDNHVHVGWYVNGYHSPCNVWSALKSAGVDEIAVSSTSACCEKYNLIIREMRLLKQMGGSCIHPILWLTPRMLRTYGIRKMMHAKVTWEGVKMHWHAHPEWGHNEELLAKGLDIVRSLKVPLLLHSGEQETCRPHLFRKICEQNPSIKIIIAHGRPLDETILLLSDYDNTFVDTAFMPFENMQTLANLGLANRVIFGTDSPIQEYYNPTMPLHIHVEKTLGLLKEAFGIKEAKDILCRTPYSILTNEMS